ncbi:NAD(P)/FAD-dependent oxidoreductase [Maribacter halichondriae]|uniref:NAD(P)/FAD-dependent oxidoreductase n=1 Tax=Maribacter halichondriae TaxID=2980554 RepID=UPI002359C67A|nr:FAD-dependent oxidoreductase [Maribacter sp. Hal144]
MTFNSNGHNGEQTTIHDVIVIGGGLMGSSAAWHLSNYGKEVVLLEKQGRVYEKGSSKGEARVVRSSNIEGDTLWSYLHNTSVKEVETVIRFLNNKGTAITMEGIYTTSPISYIARHEELGQLLNNLKNQDANFELASKVEEGESKFGVNLKEGTFLHREYNTHSGTFNPRKLIQLLHQAIALKGYQIRYNSEVTGIEKKDGVYKITVDANGKSILLSAKQVVSAAGPYTGGLLQKIAPYYNSLIHPKRVFLTFLRIKNEHYNNLPVAQKQQMKNGFPVIDRTTNLECEEFFAMIESYDEQDNPIIKIGGHFQRTNIGDIDKVWQKKLNQKEINWSIEKIASYLNFLNLPIMVNQIEVVDTYSCVYSLTETEVPFVTPILEDDNSIDENFVVIAGMSGVGAKGAMAYGLIASNLLTNKKQEDPYYETAVAKLGYERIATKTL